MKTFSTKTEPYLCEQCKPFGYCRLAIKKLKVEEESLSDSKIENWVPIRTSIKDHSTHFGKKLQQAHDLFHQQEFEQASYLYLDMLNSRNDCDEIKIGLSASMYFLEKYEDAANVAIKLDYFYRSNFLSMFITTCENKLKILSQNVETYSTNENETTPPVFAKNIF